MINVTAVTQRPTLTRTLPGCPVAQPPPRRSTAAGGREVVEPFFKQGMGGDDTIEAFREANRRLHEMVAIGIRVGVAAGTFDVPDPWLTAGLLNHAVHGFLEELVVYGDDIDRDAFVGAATQLVRRALGAAPSTPKPRRTPTRKPTKTQTTRTGRRR